MPALEPVVLITGASSGIGAALARAFAERGHRVVLVARRGLQLAQVAEAIAARGHARPHVVSLDLALPDAGDLLAQALQDAGLEPEVVVNNAGFGLLGPAAQLDRGKQLAMVDLNMRIATDLSLRFVDSLARHKGGILNVASVLGFVPGPGMAVYHATKAYLLSFSQALHHELKPRNVRVTVMCPGPIDTEFGVRAKGYLSRKLTRSVDRVVEEGIEGFMRGKAVVITGRGVKLFSVLPRLLPRGMLVAMVGASKRQRIDG